MSKKKYIPALLILVISAYLIRHFYHNNSCSAVAVIPITDHITSSPTYDDKGVERGDETLALDIIKQIREANTNRKVKAIMFEIDSHGGDGVSAQKVIYALKEVHKPTVALIRSVGDSAAYWIATATGHIFALPISDVGGIGITSSYSDGYDQNQKNGITFHQLSIGKYKDMLNPDKPLTSDEQAHIMKELEIKNQYFLQGVADNRHLSLDKVKELANGAPMTGQEALKNGLIDEYGSFAEVERYLSKVLNKDVKICIE